MGINRENRDWFYDASKSLVVLEVTKTSAYGSYIMIEAKNGTSKCQYTAWSWSDGNPPFFEGETNDFHEAYRLADLT